MLKNILICSIFLPIILSPLSAGDTIGMILNKEKFVTNRKVKKTTPNIEAIVRNSIKTKDLSLRYRKISTLYLKHNIKSYFVLNKIEANIASLNNFINIEENKMLNYNHLEK